MKIKISHLIKTTAILTGLGFLFLAESVEAQIRYSRQSNVPDFRFSIFETPDASTSDTEGRFNGAIKDISYFDDCSNSSLPPTTAPGFLCSLELSAELVPFVVKIPQANLLANFNESEKVVEYTFEVDSPFVDAEGRTYLPNDFYTFNVNLVGSGLDPTRAVNDLNYIIDNNVLAQVNFNSEMLNVLRDNGTIIRLDSPTFTFESECEGGELLRESFNDDFGVTQGICATPVEKTTVPEPNTLVGLLVLVNVSILAGLWRFLKTQ